MFGNQHSKWHISWKGVNKLDTQDGLPNNVPTRCVQSSFCSPPVHIIECRTFYLLKRIQNKRTKSELACSSITNWRPLWCVAISTSLPNSRTTLWRCSKWEKFPKKKWTIFSLSSNKLTTRWSTLRFLRLYFVLFNIYLIGRCQSLYWTYYHTAQYSSIFTPQPSTQYRRMRWRHRAASMREAE